jgi:hypothetical protein
MANLYRRFALGAVALPLLFVLTTGSARANTIVVNTLDSGSQPFPLCTLEDAVAAANLKTVPVNGCGAGSGSDEIDFAVTGTIFTDNPLVVTDSQLEIFGPPFGTPAGPPPAGGIVIDGGGTHEVIDATNSGAGDYLALYNLTLADGSITTPNHSGTFSVGGAINAEGAELYVYACSFVNNSALPSSLEGFGGAIYGGAGTVGIVDSTFAGNSANTGGAVYSSITSMFLSNVTLSGNSANPANGGGLAWNSGQIPNVNGTIVASSTGGNCRGPVIDDGYNLSDDTSGCFTAGTSKNNVHNLNLGPLGLQNNGGPTETIALETGSEAISFDKHCFDFDDEVVSVDQRLYGRPNSPTFCDSGAYEHDALANIVLVPNTERLQLVHSGSAMSDYINTAFTFIDNGPGEFPSTTCDAGNNALNSLDVGIVEGDCNELPDSGLFASMEFVQHTVNHETYGTDYYTVAGPSGGTLSGRIVALPTPAGACGEWTLNLELSGLDLANFGLTGGNPFALIITDDDDNAVCFNITNAVVGDKIVPPPTRSVRR